MSVQELHRVHRRYIRLSNHFKSAWTFHQFVQGLGKTFSEVEIPSYPADFQRIYGELKAVSQNLSESSIEPMSAELDRIEQELKPTVEGLMAADAGVSAGVLRQFFQRVKNYDDNILTQLLKFYLLSQELPRWEFPRVDKVDYLVTKLTELYNEDKDAYLLRDQTFLRELSQGLWTALESEPPADADVDGIRSQVAAIREAIANTESIEALHHGNLVEGYRQLKHGLGYRFFEPRVLLALLETNMMLKNRIHQLYKRDEQRIIAEYQQVFELERDVPVDVQLSEELNEFRQAVERFERKLEGDDVKLAEITELRDRVRSLVPKLRPDDSEDATLPVVRPREVREAEGGEGSPASPAGADAFYVEEQYQQIVAALEDTNPTTDPKKVALQPEVFHLGVGPREIFAFRRLFGGATCDEALEQFVLRAASLRVRIDAEVTEIKGILDDTAVSQEAPIFRTARATCRVGDRFVRRFEHLVEYCVLDGDIKEARDLQLLKMRLTRAFSGLWLMVHR